MLDALPTTPSGWLGWGAAALVTAIVYFPKVWAERRGDNREIDRLVAALAEERQRSKELAQLLEESRQQNNALIREFAEIKSINARMELQITHLTEEVSELREELHKSRTTP
jgi:septal ring factor EnvC (AmiA/AmiB activator)